jgi:hypothetical protein
LLLNIFVTNIHQKKKIETFFSKFILIWIFTQRRRRRRFTASAFAFQQQQQQGRSYGHS